ncbi:MAG: zinc-binding dehydrogenase [Spirochaetales bacterium]|nr:zinc-binding dehydrogenase [Spirochaetales bacterium]MCF7938711.1 zinc-binding dehydrogenase [Spirochaetales bacterium]
METKAIRLYGKNDLRLESFELPEIKEGEILAHIVSDSICMSSHKETMQGADHKRVPDDLSEKPIIIGHEFCGEIVEVGSKWADKWKPGQQFAIQPNIKWPETVNGLGAPGYSYQNIGGDATYVIIPEEVMLQDCLLEYDNPAYFYGSIAEPMSTIVAGYRATFHIEDNYNHIMGPKEGGDMAILAGAGPMGLGFIDLALHNDYKRPGRLVVTDIDDSRLDRAKTIYTPENAAKEGIELIFVNTKELDDPVAYLRDLTGKDDFDDVFCFAPVKPVVEQADAILGYDGCLNFFAGPTDSSFSATMNFYDVHYMSHHVVGTSGGNTDDMKYALKLMNEGKVNPVAMITHVGGLNSAADATLRLPEIPGGKKLIYTNIDMELTAIDDFEEKGKQDPVFAELAKIVKKNKNLWSVEAEQYLLANAKEVSV